VCVFFSFRLLDPFYHTASVRTQLNSLQRFDFSIFSQNDIHKLFRTNNIDTVKICQSQFCIELPSSVIKKRAIKFETSLKYA